MSSDGRGGFGRLAIAATVVLTLVGAACGDPDQVAEDAGPLPTVPLEVGAPEGPAPAIRSTSIRKIAGVYFGLAPESDEPGGPSSESHLVRSEDLRSWETVTLPGAADRMQLSIWGPESGSDVLTVVGRGVETVTPGTNPQSFDVASGIASFWTTADGMTWAKGPDLEDLQTFAMPRVFDIGGVLLAGASRLDGRFVLLSRNGQEDWQSRELTEVSRAVEPSPMVEGMASDTAELERAWVEGDTVVGVIRWSNAPATYEIRSADRGASWHIEACEDTGGPCGGFVQRTEGLLVRGAETSSDEGATWHPITIGPVEEYCSLEISSVVALDSGWAAVGSGGDAGGSDYDALLHSEDGRSWTVVRAPTCGAGSDGEGEGSYSYTEPVAFNGSWWSVYMPWDRYSSEPPRPLLLRSDDGRAWTEVPVPRLDGRLAEAPIVRDDELLIPISTFNREGRGHLLEGLVGVRTDR